MNGKQLKNSILQWAIQGKLVPQDPNDEPASVLLERIRAEKARLVKEGKIKKDKNESIIFRGEDNSHYEKFPDGRVICIDDEVPFEVPQGWEWCRLGIVFQLKSGQDFPPEKYSDSRGGTLYLTGASNISTVDGERIIENRWTNTPSVIAPYGSLLLVCKGSGVGKMCLMNLPEAHIARQLQAIIPITQDIDIRFVRIALECRLHEITQQANGVIPGIAREAVLTFLLPIPPRKEQERILEKTVILSSLAERYGKLQHTLDILNNSVADRLKKAILQEAILGRLVPQDITDEPATVLLERIKVEKQKLLKEGQLKKKDNVDSVIFKGEDNKYYEKVGNKTLDISEKIPFEIPYSWCWLRLSHLIAIISGTSYQKEDVVKSGIRILRGGNLQENRLYLFDDDVFLPDSYRDTEKSIREGDVVIVASTGSSTVIGKPAIIYRTDPNIQIGAFLRILRPYFSWSVKYLNLLFTTEYYREHIRIKAKGTNINNIKAEYLNDILVPLPPVEEQGRIIERVRELFRLL